MRERSKQPSYVQRFSAVQNQKQHGSPPLDEFRRIVSNCNEEKKIGGNKKESSNAPSRVRQEPEYKVDRRPKKLESCDDISGGKMIQYRSLDDIPDGLPESPKSARGSQTTFYNDSVTYAMKNKELPPAPPSNVLPFHGNNNVVQNSGKRIILGGGSFRPMQMDNNEDSYDRYRINNDNVHSQIDQFQDEHRQATKVFAKSDYASESIMKPIVKHVPQQVPQPAYQKEHHTYNDNNDDDDDDFDDDDCNDYVNYSNKGKYKIDVDRTPLVATNSGGKQAQKHSISVPQYIPALPVEMQSSPPSNDVPEKDKLFFSKHPRQVEYKPYTLEQYKLIKPKEYVEISKLTPDLNSEVLKAKRANVDRVKEFSRNLKSFNEKVIKEQPRLPKAQEAVEIDKSKQKLESKRERAIQFAKQIPKPSTRTQKDEMSSKQHSEINDDFSSADPYSFVDETKFVELEARHNASKRQVDAIKKSLGLG